MLSGNFIKLDKDINLMVSHKLGYMLCLYNASYNTVAILLLVVVLRKNFFF